ncbi:hypothetical protein CkaCkLH20_13264 [Colletotrichum karsti]|uniref:Uncharacterized protein n=1 Tax=Colletotrichum karsti TaxID=1095194 RepID=A0A9P6HRU4_9PEZI|nr:uncharacterized protein CkaCkLH20_13264 [Colletotrichum karsti]KAF9869262.1 hypothetical protein CkaCkLH20_13264 [Colletotrichum karsti]
MPPSSRLERLAAILSQATFIPAKASIIEEIFSSTSAPFQKSTNRVFFRFEQRRIPMTCTLFRCPPSASASASPASTPPISPAFLYVDRSDIRSDREASLEHISRRLPNGRSSKPTYRLYSARLAQITPADPSREPYMAGLLIALAQAQRRCLRRDAPTPEGFQVHVLASHIRNHSSITVFSAVIPTATLDKLSLPNWTPRAASNFGVRCTEIPYEPYASFQERLLQAITPQELREPTSSKRSWESDESEDETRKYARPE